MRGSLHWSVSLPQHVVAGTCLYAGGRKVGGGGGSLVNESSSACCGRHHWQVVEIST